MKYANDQTIAKIDFAILCYTQTTSMTSVQYADHLFANSCKDAVFYNESSLNVIFIEGVDSSIWHSLWKYRDSNPQANVIDIAFKAQSLLAIEEGMIKRHMLEIKTLW